ncbi:MAG: DEAD/DEAH box helicase [Xanthomonadales bacterium]|nr:DEAD/DEAH box helicase [Xanthomonadales bacterium]
MSFDTLGLAAPLLRALAELGYRDATEIQSLAIPAVLAGDDVLAGARTGTGKTAAFALPLLQQMSTQPPAPSRRPRALVLTPTRELAAQIQDNVVAYGKHLKLRSATIFGGVGMQPQIDALRRGLDIAIATPGRLIDLMGQRHVDLSGIEYLVLDEADRMLDMGFLPAIRRILGALPKQRQTLLFSATFAPEIRQIAEQFMRTPRTLQATPENSAAPQVTHRLHPVDQAKKKDLLIHLMAEDSRQQRLVFSRTKHGADKLCRVLCAAGHKAMAIHGNKSQSARIRALDDFKSGRISVLVATDIAARGIDIDDLPVVINYDLPMVAEDYVHRIGRTGRNGRTGEAISLACAEESDQLRAIHRLLGNDIPRVEIEGFVPSVPLKLTAGGHAQRKPQPQRARPHGQRDQGARHHAGRPHHGGGRNGQPGQRRSGGAGR